MIEDPKPLCTSTPTKGPREEQKAKQKEEDRQHQEEDSPAKESASKSKKRRNRKKKEREFRQDKLEPPKTRMPKPVEATADNFEFVFPAAFHGQEERLKLPQSLSSVALNRIFYRDLFEWEVPFCQDR